ncbi:MAG: amino-acid N-acetyltransferase [Verrucomicrobiales bacterium]|jgi:amino-acid N-acetyltransferase|nr:amino-acid N-acetyltransferase [Verrucomicrobiales bacterium]
MEISTEQKVRFGDLRAILRYVPLFRGQRFVVAVDGAVLDSGGVASFLLDLAVLQSLNIQIILVYGAGHQIRLLAEERDQSLTCADGTGCTDEATLELSIDAISRLANQLREQATVSNIRTASANVLVAHQAGRVRGVDQGLTGVIDRVDTQCLKAFLDDGLLPIISPIGHDRRGQTLRLNSDSVATEVALAVGASKILFVTEAHVTDTDGQRVKQLSVEQAHEMAQGRSGLETKSPMLTSKLKHAARGCYDGIARVHVVSGKERDALLAELFSNEGSGTMIYRDAYQEIRLATQADIPAIVAMIRPSITDEDLVPRTSQDVTSNLSDHSVIEIDGNIVGCVALHPLDEKNIELACLFIKKNHENHGYGRKLVEFAIRRAAELGATSLFALTTGAVDFFDRIGGFKIVDKKALPKKRRVKLEASARESHVLRCDLVAVATTSK